MVYRHGNLSRLFRQQLIASDKERFHKLGKAPEQHTITTYSLIG